MLQGISAFIKLIRWPNLVFIFITQILFEFTVIIPAFREAGLSPNLSGSYIYLLALSSILIAAGGNIINDYFDVNIDLINKPHKVIISKYIHRHWAILWHILLSLAGVLLGLFIEFKTHAYLLGLTNLLCVVLLFVYSIVLKRKPLSGNIVIALLTAWTVLVVTFCESNLLFASGTRLPLSKITRLTFLYGGFAFILTLVREMIKDMEDIGGDSRYNCRTFPIVFGVNAARIYVAVWLVVLLALLAIMTIYVLQFGWWLSAIYCVGLLIVPTVQLFKKLLKSAEGKDFHEMSSLVKWIMLTGILTMLFLILHV
ncbi:geranylgeranylglycerol-phosphate geranylgeranyltransferase [Arachidicoccus terrestris]|uniref:geranylgeranylglycerol-phosphate geranylgeranyltransferase n=1 Tax=Arachidicoccus terrestris TaxID=2875539 RepID=UPI001CC730EA|nr:geranylgeranylglycerol-phosphate geranylgeranyltransferase [Arachidicoccus terrestris]UAY56326.1 geranylgeranylglycerol-phosphate geranylgeranyltransferase [Arachidicoccus terrestris]